jgi:SAM-dependent methyltransferase
MTDRLTIDELARAYEGMEGPGGFADEAAVREYRRSTLERNAAQAAFIADHLEPDASVLEIGCGNGRLLIDLAGRGRCGRGLGIDLARSRIDFARAWAADEGVSRVRFEAADALTFDWGEGWDAVVCVTSAFAYFEPIAPGTAAELARRFHAALRPGGLLVVEVYPHVRWRRMMEATGESTLRLWHELPPEDPWRFYLSDLRLDGGTLSHAKTFVHRHDGRVDTGRREQLELYTADSLREVLEGAGFRDVAAYGAWEHRPWDEDELLVATARA